MCFTTQEVEDILKIWENKKENKICNVWYQEATDWSNFVYDLPSSDNEEDLKWILDRYATFTNSWYDEKGFVTMLLKCKRLCEILELNKEYGEEFWKIFLSPTEVLAFHILRRIWPNRLIEVNVWDPTNKYHVDFIIRDHQGNIICIIDVQGGEHKTEKDLLKVEYFGSEKIGIHYLQITGFAILKNCIGSYHLFLELFRRSFQSINVPFFYESRTEYTKKDTAF